MTRTNRDILSACYNEGKIHSVANLRL